MEADLHAIVRKSHHFHFRLPHLVVPYRYDLSNLYRTRIFNRLSIKPCADSSTSTLPMSSIEILSQPISSLMPIAS
jgi:hypothetical protein